MKEITTIARRSVVAGLALGIASLPTRAFARHDRTVGEFELTVLSDGLLMLPTSLVLPTVGSDALHEVVGSPPESGFAAQTNVLVIIRGRERIVVDCGGGTNFQASLGRLPAHLEAAGIAPASVTQVVFTHAHPDHLWGAIDEFGEPLFPNATYVVSDAEWLFWTNRDTIRGMSEPMVPMATGAARILKLLEPRLIRRRPGDAIAAGITVVDTAGHTPGHVSLLLETSDGNLLIGGDVLTHERVSFARPDWEWGTDHEPARAVRARHAALTLLAEGGMLAAYHLPYPGIGRVERSAGAFRFVPA